MHTSHFFFLIIPPTTEIYTLSLHDALPISNRSPHGTASSRCRCCCLRGRPRPFAAPEPRRCAAVALQERGERRCLAPARSEEHTSELQSLTNLVCRLLLEKKKIKQK